MKIQAISRLLFLLIIGLCIHPTAKAQQRADRMLEVLDTANLEGQYLYIHNRTLIYENFRAIREDVFQKLRSNTLDSLKKSQLRILELSHTIESSQDRNDSLNANLYKLNNELEIAIKNKNSIKFIGIQTNKILYKSAMWAVVIGLATLLVLLFLIFRRNLRVTVKIRKDLDETTKEYENYKLSARERYEKLVVSHHNEIKKLKGR